jgi:HEAT repeat protein
LARALHGLNKHITLTEKQMILQTIGHIAREYKLDNVDAQVAALMTDEFDPTISEPSLSLLVKLKSKLATPYLIDRLQLNNSTKRYYALQDLHRIGAKNAIPQIAQLLNHTNSNTQYWAVWCLAEFDGREYGQAIFNACVKGKPTSKLRPYFVAVLIRWGDQRCIPLAMTWLTDRNHETRYSMASALEKVKASQIEDALIQYLSNTKPVVQDHGTESNIRNSMMRLLGKFQSQNAVPVLRNIVRQDRGGRSEIAAAQLGVLRAKTAVPELLSMLDHSNYSRRMAATLALAKIGDVTTISRVVDELRKHKTNSHHVRVLAALSVVTDPKTQKTLQNIKLQRLQSLPVDQYMSQLTSITGVQIVVHENIEPEKQRRIVVGQTGHTGYSALQFGADVLNYSGHNHTIFIDKGIVNVVKIPEAYRRWDQWLKQHLNK